MKRLLLRAFVLAALAVPVQAQTLAENLEAARTAARAEVALGQDEMLAAFTFRPTVQDGVLTVVGAVATAEQRDRVANVAGDVDGVVRLVNRVRVTRAAGEGRPMPPPADQAEPDPETAPEPAPQAAFHTVRSGDTLGGIARRYGVTVGEVQRLNGLRGSQIRIGQRLRVK